MKPVLHGCAGVSLDRSYLMDSEADRYFGEGQVQDAKRVVFVVDDEPVIAQPLALILNQAGFRARAFDHPDKAIAARAEMAPDLLISDVMMPGMTGVELAIHFREAQPECKVLLFSGQAITTDLLKKARELGYDFELLRNLSIQPTFWHDSGFERRELWRTGQLKSDTIPASQLGWVGRICSTWDQFQHRTSS